MQVSGELSNDGQPMRRFMQTFVLAPGEVSTCTAIMQTVSQSIHYCLFIHVMSVSQYAHSKYVHVTVVLMLYYCLD